MGMPAHGPRRPPARPLAPRHRLAACRRRWRLRAAPRTVVPAALMLDPWWAAARRRAGRRRLMAGPVTHLAWWPYIVLAGWRGNLPRPVHVRPGRSPAAPAARYEQPEVPHRMTRGGSSWSRTLTSSVRPSVSSACRVSAGRPSGSLDQAVALISITICATSAPRVISQRQPRASPSVRACLPRFVLICQPTNARLRHTCGSGRAGRDDLRGSWPVERHFGAGAVPCGFGLRSDHSQ